VRRPESADIPVTLVKFNLLINFDTINLSQEGTEPVRSVITALAQRLGQTAPYNSTESLIPLVQ